VGEEDATHLRVLVLTLVQDGLMGQKHTLNHHSKHSSFNVSSEEPSDENPAFLIQFLINCQLKLVYSGNKPVNRKVQKWVHV